MLRWLAVIALVLFAALVTATAAEPAKPAAVATDPQGKRVELYTEQLQCEKGWNRVALFHPDKTPTEYGCWATDGNAVYIKWDDGMKDIVPIYVFEDPGAKPSKGRLQDQKNPMNTSYAPRLGA